MTDSRTFGASDKSPDEPASEPALPADATVPIDPIPGTDLTKDPRRTAPSDDPFADPEDSPEPEFDWKPGSSPDDDVPAAATSRFEHTTSQPTTPPPPRTEDATSTDGTDGSPAAAAGTEPPSEQRRFRRPSVPGSFGQSVRLGRGHRMPDPRVQIAACGAVVVLIALLASEAGVAIMLAAVVLPIVLIVTLDRVDVFDREPALILLGIGTAGAAAGTLIGLLNRFFLDEFWDETSVDRIGAVGLAGELVGRVDSPPLAIYALAGVVVPGLSLAAMLAAPVAARRWPAFRNEVMDGVTLGAAAAGGFALGTTLVHLWPLITGDRIEGSVADWTVAVLSIVVFRPVILMTIAALVGLAIWQFDLSRNTRDMVVPLAAGLGGAVGFAVIGLLAEQSGSAVQFLFNLAVAGVLLGAGRFCLQKAIDFDRTQLVGSRVVCPNCRRITPAGKFCAFCQNPLPSEAEAA